MHDDFVALRKFQTENGKNFATAFIALIDTEPDSYHTLSFARRRIKGYYKKIILLEELKVLDRRVIKAVVTEDQTAFLYEVVEPIERGMVSQDSNLLQYENSIFRWAAQLHEKANT